MRYTVLDSWRGICAVLVVLHHAASAGPLGSSALIRGAFLFVDFFFVLSGFVIAEAYGRRIVAPRSVLTFLLRRFGRVWPLHMAVLVVLVLLEFTKLFAARRWGIEFSNTPFDGVNEISALPFHVLLLNAMNFVPELTWNYPSWSIGAEYWTYSLFAVVAYFARTRAVAVSVVVAISAATALVMCSHTLMDTTYDFGYLRCIFGFFVGSVLHGCLRRYDAFAVRPARCWRSSQSCLRSASW